MMVHKFTSFRFWGSQITYDSSGQIDIFRAVPVHLPSKKYSLQIQKSDFEIRDGIKLLPKPKIIPEKDFGYTMHYEDYNTLKATVLPSINIVEIVDIGETSFGYVGTIRFHPVQIINPGKVKIYTKIIVRVEFGAPHNSGVFASSLMRGIIPKETRSKKGNYRQNVNADFPLAQGEWYRIEIREIGIYKLDYDYFNRSNIAVSNINSFRLFGNGGRQLPEDPSIQRPESLQEITRLIIDKNNDGKFDPEDYIVFYGRGTSYWSYDANKKTYNHSINTYSEKNYYFFTFGAVNGRTMDSISSVSDPFTSPKTDFQEKVFVEQERYNLHWFRSQMGWKTIYRDRSNRYLFYIIIWFSI